MAEEDMTTISAEQLAEYIFAGADKDGNGWLSRNELKKFLSGHATLKQHILERGGLHWKTLFDALDENHDGRIQEHELAEFLTDLPPLKTSDPDAFDPATAREEQASSSNIDEDRNSDGNTDDDGQHNEQDNRGSSAAKAEEHDDGSEEAGEMTPGYTLEQEFDLAGEQQQQGQEEQEEQEEHKGGDDDVGVPGVPDVEQREAEPAHTGETEDTQSTPPSSTAVTAEAADEGQHSLADVQKEYQAQLQAREAPVLNLQQQQQQQQQPAFRARAATAPTMARTTLAPQQTVMIQQTVVEDSVPASILYERTAQLTRQRLYEMWNAKNLDRSRVTHDASVEQHLQSLVHADASTQKLLPLFTQYSTALEGMIEAETEFKSYLAHHAVHARGVPSTIMQGFSDALKGSMAEDQALLDKGVAPLINTISTFRHHILPDAQREVKVLADRRRAMDAHKSWLKSKATQRRPTNHMDAITKLQASSVETYQQERRDAVTKILLTDDYRIRVLSEHMSNLTGQLAQSRAKLAQTFAHAAEENKRLLSELQRDLQTYTTSTLIQPQQQQQQHEEQGGENSGPTHAIAPATSTA